MVLQRDANNPIWGWADAGETVKVSARDQVLQTVADARGHWRVELKPMNVGDPFVLRIQSAEDEIELENVVVGEVWVCSGQSNMEWTVNGSGNPETEKRNANFPLIRHVKIQRKVSNFPMSKCQTSGWQVCNPETAGQFSAVGYYFGRKLHQELNVPIGLINTSWGGTIVEAWTSAETLKSHPDFTERIAEASVDVDKLAESQKKFELELKQWKSDYSDAVNRSLQTEPKDLADTGWSAINVPGPWERQGFVRFDGVGWYQKTIELSDDLVGKRLELSLGQIDDNDRTFVNGKKVGETSGWNKPRTYSIPSDLNTKKSLTISVQVHDLQGAGGIHGKAKNLFVAADSSKPISLSGSWKFSKAAPFKELPKRPVSPGFNGPNNPTALFNGMVNPLIPFQFKGAIWYQGESNAGRAHQYRELFPLLIQDWRKKWNSEFPFYWVQLANFMKVVDQPGASAWAELREAQSMTLKLPKTGQAVIIDIGEARDIHPKNKQDVGKRLAWIALKNDYGFENMQAWGPRYREMTIEGDRIRLKFDDADGIRASDGKPLARFEIAGEDKSFVWANAVIDGKDVVVSASSVTKPVAVRYAWSNNPEGCNLTNQSGVPASPFRTDDWPGVTVGSR